MLIRVNLKSFYTLFYLDFKILVIWYQSVFLKENRLKRYIHVNESIIRFANFEEFIQLIWEFKRDSAYKKRPDTPK